MVTSKLETEENIVSDANVKEANGTIDTKEGTDTSDVPQPFPAPLALQDTPDVPDTPAADSEENVNLSLQTFMPKKTEEEPSKSPSPGQIAAVPSQPILLNQTAVAPQVPAANPSQSSQKTSVFMSNSDYMRNGGLMQDIVGYQGYAARKTGFPNIDSRCAFMPGLYMIMGETSSGKTTFAIQFCDQIAMRGEYVLYFALEQSRFFLTSKSLSRQFFWEHYADKKKNGQSDLPCYTSLDIRSGRVDNNELNRQIASYTQGVRDRMWVISTNFSGDINDICECVDQFMQRTGHRPVIVADYIQIIPPSIMPNGNMLDTKTSLDQGIHKLKQFQEENDLTVLAISSMSRTGYLEEIALSHAKETGSLEYTCDVAIGLQLRAKHDYYKIVNQTPKKMTEAERKAHIASAKTEAPRKIEAVYLKDRFGSVGSVAYFDYYSAFETFVATDMNGNPLV